MKFKHLEKTGYSYFEHFKMAFLWGTRMLALSLFAFIHAIWPDAFTYTVTDSIKKYAEEIKNSEKT